MDVMKAKKYNGQDPTGYWMSEKLDGVRAVWDGEKLLSINGNVFAAPAWFTNGIPATTILDGELWEGRGLFQQTVGKIRAKNGDWSDIKFMLFDIVNNAIYEIRRPEIRNLDLPDHCRIVDQTLCEGENHLNKFEAEVLSAKGEGVMLRKPNSLYTHARTHDLLKVKKFQSAEAIVVDYKNGQGKHKGRIGALVCEYMGKIFCIGRGLSDALRETPPKVGAKITFAFLRLTDAGVPYSSSFVAARNYE